MTMLPHSGEVQDVMQVCRNGHVITNRLRSDPDSGRTHCNQCGAATLARCLTCGQDLPGAGLVLDLVTIGACAPPRFCPGCGAAFPWVRRPRPAAGPLALLDPLLRRLPLVIRQLRWRQGDRPPFRMEDERDLDDLLRALLPLHFDDVRLESRTPRYSACTRTDLLLAHERTALAVKWARAGLREPQLAEQGKEDVAYYRQRAGCRALVVFVYDPEALLRDRPLLETMAEDRGDLEVRCIVGEVQGGSPESL
jgi:hypothetical protein